MDAAERADIIYSSLYDDRDTFLSVLAEQISQAEQAARQDERRKVLEALARIYLCDGCSLPVAEVCDEYLDRSGALLGEVRDCARALAEEVT